MLYSLRTSRDTKDVTIRSLQQELHNCHDMLEAAQKEKVNIVDKMREIQNEKQALDFDYQWMCDKVFLFSIFSTAVYFISFFINVNIFPGYE